MADQNLTFDVWNHPPPLHMSDSFLYVFTLLL